MPLKIHQDKTGLVAPKVILLTGPDETTQEDFEIAIAALRKAGA